MREHFQLVRERPKQVRGDISDAELLRMLSEDQKRAVLATWLRFAPLVHRLLKRALGPEDDVRDLAQVVFAELFRRVAEVSRPNELRPLVVTITMNIIRVELRNRWIHRWLGVGQADASPRTSSIPPDPTSREALRRLYFILDRFKTEDRIAFAFHFLEGLSLEETAGALNLSLPDAQRVLARVWNRIVHFVERDTALLDYLASVERQGACA